MLIVLYNITGWFIFFSKQVCLHCCYVKKKDQTYCKLVLTNAPNNASQSTTRPIFNKIFKMPCQNKEQKHFQILYIIYGSSEFEAYTLTHF